jgi:hypothetical protein
VRDGTGLGLQVGALFSLQNILEEREMELDWDFR